MDSAMYSRTHIIDDKEIEGSWDEDNRTGSIERDVKDDVKCWWAH